MRLSDAVVLFLSRERIECGAAAPGSPLLGNRYYLRALGNCCLMWIIILADEVKGRIDICVTGSHFAQKCKMSQVARFLALANEGDDFGKFALENGTNAVVYATTALAGDLSIEPDAIAFAVRIAGTRYDRLYPGLVQVISAGADPDKLWPVIERPDWDRINRECGELSFPISWKPPVDLPVPRDVLSLRT